jgi:hypothetical protein
MATAPQRISGKRVIGGNIVKTYTQQVSFNLGDVAATADFILPGFEKNITVLAVKVGTGTTVTADDTNYWTISVQDKGAAGTGTDEVMDTTSDANTTKATGGQGLTANVFASFAVNSANADITAGYALKLTLTKVASATTLDGANVIVQYRER